MTPLTQTTSPFDLVTSFLDYVISPSTEFKVGAKRDIEITKKIIRIVSTNSPYDCRRIETENTFEVDFGAFEKEDDHIAFEIGNDNSRLFIESVTIQMDGRPVLIHEDWLDTVIPMNSKIDKLIISKSKEHLSKEGYL